MKAKIVFLSLITFAAAAGGTPAMADLGSETGHGGRGDRVRSYDFERVGPREWCSKFGPMVGDILDDVREADTLPAKREALVEGIKAIMKAYDAREMPFQPLTYSLLSTALKLNANFPSSDSKGDQAAGILLSKMLSTAQKVNVRFDLPRMGPVLDAYPRCRHYRCSGDGWDRDTNDLSDEFYIDYLSAAQSVVDMLFETAVSNSAATVLDAMAYDRWQLVASLDVLNYILGSLRMDIFSRSLACLQTRVEYVTRRLNEYLSSTPISPERDMLKRKKIEGQLFEIKYELDGVHHRNGHWACEYRPRH